MVRSPADPPKARDWTRPSCDTCWRPSTERFSAAKHDQRLVVTTSIRENGPERSQSGDAMGLAREMLTEKPFRTLEIHVPALGVTPGGIVELPHA